MSDVPNKLLTIKEVAELCSVGVDKVQCWITSRQLIAINVAEKIGVRARWRVDPADLDAFLESRRSRQLPKRPTGHRRRLHIPKIVELEAPKRGQHRKNY